ncbi:MAG: hypothetical protein ACRENS_07800 [Candidatus Eiseniibacteriota bacterium]
MLRLTALLALALGLAALGVFLTVMGEGPLATPAARHLREMKSRTAAPDSVSAVTLADMAALPRRVPLAQFLPLEAHGVSIEGYVQNMLRAGDGDLHLEVAASPRLSAHSDTAYVTAEITPPWSRSHPHWTFQDLAPVLRPTLGGPSPWPGGTHRMRISGWLMYDWQHDEPFSRRDHRKSAPRLTGWEIHPVTRLEAWNDTLARFVDVEP